MKHPSRLALFLLALALPPLAATAVADETILLVNSYYTDGEPTELGPVGYSSFDAAQAAVTDKAATTIRATVEDDTVEKPEFTADVFTKDYRTEFVGREGERLDLKDVVIVVGDPAADVERADVSISYADNISKISVGNVTGTASLVIDHAVSDEDPGIGCLDLTGSFIADLKVAISNSFVATMKLPDQEATHAEITVRNTAIASLEGSGSSSLTVLDEDYPSTGRYVLAENAEAFSGVVIVRGADGESASLSIGGPFAAQWGKSYSLALSGGRLVLVVRPPAIPVAYFDPRPDMPRDAVTNGFPYAGEACLDAGWYVVTGAVRVAGRIAVCDDANLVLADGAELVAEKGIGVNDLFDGVENSLSIWAQGTNASAGRLTATAPGNAAAIGGDESCGTVRVYGGRISAVGGEGGAGIGSGSGTVENGPGFGGAVYVYGGTVEARGGAGAAGIGLGFRGSEGEVFVYGGDVTAVGGGNPPPDEGAPFVSDGPLVDTGVGIGGSDVGVFIGHESAFGCTVVATGGAGAAGIYGYPVEIVDDATVTAESGAGDQPLPAILSAEDIYIGEGLVILEPPGGRMSNERPFIVSGGEGEEQIATRVVIGPPPPPTPLLAVTIEDVFYSQTVFADVDFGYDDATGTVAVAVGGTNFTETVTGRLARVEMPGFDAGGYEARIEFTSANPDLTDATTNATFTVWKADSAIEIVDIKDSYLKGETIDFRLRRFGSTGAVTVAINGEPCADDVFDRDALTVSFPDGLEAGTHVVEVFLEGDANHNGSSDTKTFPVICHPVEITDVAAEQTAPGEPTVRLAFSLSEYITGNNYPSWNPPFLSVTATNPATGAVFLSTPGSLSGDVGPDGGRHEVVWDMSALLPEGFGAEGLVFTVAWLTMPDWCVLDLSGGTAATNVPVSYLDAPPDGGFANETYRTANLAMRLLPAGTYRMGGTNKVEIARPFYCAVFETTQRQWELVTGGTPSEHEGATRPVESVSYGAIRGDDASFLAVLRAKSGLAALDLPTGTQWEYACRAGTTNLYYYGYNCFGGSSEEDLKNLGRHAGNRDDGRGGFEQHTAAGSYLPNPWGLYDMHGNVREWCQDGASAWGGGWNSPAGDCTSSSRASYDSSTARDDLGFRLVRLLPDDAQTERLGERFDPAARPGALCSGATSLDVAVWRHFATNDVVLADCAAVYDGAAHGIGVATNAIDGLALRYAARPAGDAGAALAFSAEVPLFTDVTNATIWVEATAPGYFPATNAATVSIAPATPLLDVRIDDVTYPAAAVAVVDVGFGAATGAVTVVVVGTNYVEAVATGTTNYAGTVSGGCATVALAGLPAGIKVARVEFVSATPNLTGAATNAMFTVWQTNSDVRIECEAVYACGEQIVLNVVPTGSSGDTTVYLNGMFHATFGEPPGATGYEVVLDSIDDAGTYLVEAFLDADESHLASSASATIRTEFLTSTIEDVEAEQPARGIPEVRLSFTAPASFSTQYFPSWNEPRLVVTATDPATGATYVSEPGALSGDTEPNSGETTPDEKWNRHEVVWDMSGVLPEIFSADDMDFTVAYANTPGYCVIDLSGGADATNAPVSYLDAPPAGGWTAADRTTNLVMRLVGSSYCAVFETTQRQWELVMGEDANPSAHKGPARPVENVSYVDVRGGTEGLRWPETNTVDEASFLGVLRRRTGLPSLDLPDVSQWFTIGLSPSIVELYEHGLYVHGGPFTNDLVHLGRFDGNRDDGRGGFSQHTLAGSYLPTDLGFYDLYGNVREWCLDPDPETGSNRKVLGGGWTQDAEFFGWAFGERIGSAFGTESLDASEKRADTGFRLVWTLPDDEEGGFVADPVPGGQRPGTLCSGSTKADVVVLRHFATNDVVLADNEAAYDEAAHGIGVATNAIDGLVLRYAARPAGDAGAALAFSEEVPLFTDVTNAIVWVEATAPGHFPATNSATVAISPATPSLAVSIADTTYPETVRAVVDVGFDVAGAVTVTVGETNVAGAVVGGCATVDLLGLDAGSNQVARVEFVSGSANVTGAATNATFNVDKAESTLNVSVESDLVSAAGEDVLIWLTPSGSSGDISVFINGRPCGDDVYDRDAKEVLIPGDLDAGDYLVEAFLAADTNYTATNATAMFKVESLAAEITDVRAVQTAPWIPKATLSFTLSDTLDRRYRPSWNEPCLSVTAYDPATGATYVAPPERLSGDTNAVEGVHSVTWDMSDVLPAGFVSDGLAFTVSYLRMPEFCVLDLSGGADATNIPVSYLDAPPASGWTAADKTTNLVLRLLPPWSFTMGRENVAGNPPHEVALERPFYCAVFETTQRQWELATGDNPSYHAGRPDSAMRPVEQVSYDDIRGATEGAEWPASGAVDEDSFLGILRRKTGLAALDLPSEAQWEYAGRAGMAILDTVQVNSTYEVGLDAPNAWILCGMHGNVWEWCLDRHGDLASGAATDPVGPAAGTNRVLRGGGYAESERDNTLSDRRGDAPSRIRPDYGFRLVRNLAGDTRAERAGEIAAGAARAGTLCSGTATAALDCSPSPWKLLQAALAAGEDVVLTNDVACDDQSLGPLVVPAGVTASLDLNGHTVDRALAAPVQNGRVFVVETNGTLAISDSAGGGVVTGGNTIGDVAVDGGGDGSGNVPADDDRDDGGRGGGAFVAAGGSLTMTGGMFATNAAWGGGAICSLGSLRVTGSAFVGNEANSVIYIDGTNAVVSFCAFAGSSRLIFFSTNPPALYDGDSHSDTTILPPVNDNWFGAFGSRSKFKPSVGGFGGYLCNMTRWCFLKIEREIDEITGKCRLKATPCIYDMALEEHILEISAPADYRLPPIPLRCIATDATFDGATATNPATIRLSKEGYTTAAFEPRTNEGNGYRYTVGVVVPWDETLVETLTFERSIAVGGGGALAYTFPADVAVAAFDGTNALPAAVLAGKTVSVALDGVAGAFSAVLSSNGTFRLDLGDAVSNGTYAATFSIPGFKPAETTLEVAIPPKYTLVYDAGGGSGEMESRTVYEGETFTFPGCDFGAPAGKGGFDHWGMSGVDGLFQDGSTVTIASNCAQEGTVTVTAYWKKGPPPFVADVRARQRWPWNGLVDVDYEVGGDPDDLAGLAARISFVEQGDAGRTWVATNFLENAGPSAEPGPHRATWDTAADGATNVVAAKVTATVELVREPPVSDGNVWSLIGDFNSWGGDVDMTLTDGKWVSPVTKIAAGGFKIRFNHDWTENVGGVMEALGTPFAAISGGDNISIEEGNDYVVTYDPEEQTILVEVIGWGVVGTINSWGGSADLAMKEENGMFVRKNVTLTADDEIKVRYRNSWDVNYGGRTDVGFAVEAISGGDNLEPGAGTYDIWLDAEKKALFVMEAGEDPEYWGVVGTINGWGGTPDAVMYHDAEGYFVAKGIALAADDEIKIRKNSDWTDNRGASDAAPDTALDAVAGGDNIKVAAGTYDVYYQSASEKIYVMTAGKTPADAQ